MRSPRQLAVLALAIGVAGVAVAGTHARREPDPRPASGEAVAAGAEPVSAAGTARRELPRLGTAALLGGGLVGLAVLGARRRVSPERRLASGQGRWNQL